MPFFEEYPCVKSNPDIAGIGVRISIYTQALLNLAQSAVFSWDGIPEPKYYVVFTASINLFITGCAIVVAAFIQAYGEGLSIYHALIVLCLGWINSLSAVQPLVTCWAEPSFRQKVVRSSVLSKKFIHQHNIACLLATLHLSAVSCIGIWLWIRVDLPVVQPSCTARTVGVMLGAVTSFGDSLGPIGSVHFIFFWPYINLLVIFILMYLYTAIMEVLIILLYLLFKRKYEKRGQRFITLMGIIIVEINLMIAVESMISTGSVTSLVNPGESEWSFGQVLAMLMTVFPLLELIKGIWKRFKSRRVEDETDIIVDPYQHVPQSLPAPASTFSKNQDP